MKRSAVLLRAVPALTLQLAAVTTSPAFAAGFDKINDTVNNVVAILVLISVAVVTAAIIWAGYKMLFQAARLSDVAHVLFGGTLIGGASAMAAFIVS